MIRTATRLCALVAAAAGVITAGVIAVGGCADNGTAPALPGQLDTSAYDAVIGGSPVADASAITPGSWADKVKQRGTLDVGGTDAGPLFSLKNPATGKVTGFDAGLSQMLGHYITGKPTGNTRLTITTVDTRETLIQNGTVDAVFGTYTITPARAAKVAFAGPYYESGDAIMVKAGNTAIHSVADLNGKTVATEANSTAALACRRPHRARTRCCSSRTPSASPQCSRAGPTPTYSTRPS
ncbi:MAG: transporter substrate-binding domain-containing protein [Pseudonocardiaceae bacterium]